MDDIKDIQPIQEIPLLSPLGWFVVILSISILFLILGLITRKWLKSRNKKIIILSPYEEALQQLSSINPSKEGIDAKTFSTSVSSTVRQFLEDQFHLPAPERTTEEFLDQMKNHSLIQGKISQQLGNFLKSCDLAKFAGQNFSLEQRKSLLKEAEAFITNTYKLFQHSQVSESKNQSN